MLPNTNSPTLQSHHLITSLKSNKSQLSHKPEHRAWGRTQPHHFHRACLRLHSHLTTSPLELPYMCMHARKLQNLGFLGLGEELGYEDALKFLESKITDCLDI